MCLKDGQLEINVDEVARNYMERMIYNFTGIKVAKTQQEEEKRPKPQEDQGVISYVCLECHEYEEIPLDVVRTMDAMDDGDPGA